MISILMVLSLIFGYQFTIENQTDKLNNQISQVKLEVEKQNLQIFRMQDNLYTCYREINEVCKLNQELVEEAFKPVKEVKQNKGNSIDDLVNKDKYIELTITSYSKQECPNKHTATGTIPTPKRTVAVSRDMFPKLKGKTLIIKGFGAFKVEDSTAPGISRTVDIFSESRSKALKIGRTKALVKIAKN